MYAGDQGVFPWPGETPIPVMLLGGARKNTHVPPKPRALWRLTDGLGAYGGVEIVGIDVMESAPSRR